MQHTPIITEEKLHSHADYAESRGLIPELLFRLICASVQNPSDLRIPIGGSIGQSGWDGILNSPIAFDPYVPQGLSFWEIGVGSDPAKKATEDFRKRTQKTSEDERSSSTYIFVTARSAQHGWTIDKQRSWMERRNIKKWGGIRIIDGTKLVQWLYLFPEVDLWLANKFDMPTNGLTTPARHWEILQDFGSPPKLKPEVFLVGRNQAVQKLQNLFQGDAQELLLETRYPIEGVDFISAFLASLDLVQQTTFAGRCLIIDDPSTWKSMCNLQTSHVLIPTPALDVDKTGADLRQMAKSRRHAVIFASGPSNGSHGNSVRLYEAKPHELEEVLKVCGYDVERARQISGKCGGSIPILKRLLLDLSASPDWASGVEASNLAIAALIGRWNGNLVGDREAIEKCLGKPYGEWIRIIRPMTLRPDPPLIQRDERWKFVSRFEGWQFLGPFLSDEDLETFRVAVLEVLCEIDPRLSLPPEDRWSAAIHGKQRRYSDTIREGIAETLALLGSHSNTLSSCTHGKPEIVAIMCVREILNDADWYRWASLNDVLPLLAEAAPNEFLHGVEIALKQPDESPFQGLFGQEHTTGIGGANYMTGLLWSLETLAWHADYLVRVTVILGQLDEMDPGGNWGNRPATSLNTIFLPWLPQTCAPVAKRRAAIEALLKEHPRAGWKFLLNILPTAHGTSMGSRKPTWQEFIPSDHSDKVSQIEYRQQIVIYAELAVTTAATDLSRLVELIGRLDDLPFPVLRQLLTYLSSESLQKLSEAERLPLWEGLMDLTTKHRKFADAQWAMNSEILAQIDMVTNKLKPDSPFFLHHRLFTGRDFDLVDEYENFEMQYKKLELRRQEAVGEILAASGIDGVIKFAHSVAEPRKVGFGLGLVADQNSDSVLLPTSIESEAGTIAQFCSGFIWGRFRSQGWHWVDSLNFKQWTNEQKGAFLACLPFESETWRRAEKLLETDQAAYWMRASGNPYESEKDLVIAVEHLLIYGRARAALQCVERLIREKASILPALVIRALGENLSSKESVGSLDGYAIIDIISWLQENPETDINVLAQIEWSYLPLLNHRHPNGEPKTLERRLAGDPAFFCEVIRTVFRSDKEERPEEEPSEEIKNIAQNAYHLLHEWQIAPGSKTDGGFDAKEFTEWLAVVKQLSKDSGHWGVAMNQIGKVLAYTPADPDGLWIHKSVAESLNSKDAEEMRSGFTCEFFNMRGVHGFTAGQEERELAADYRGKADAVEQHGYHRLATSLRMIASSYDREAERDATRDPFEDFS